MVQTHGQANNNKQKQELPAKILRRLAKNNQIIDQNHPKHSKIPPKHPPKPSQNLSQTF